LMAFEQFLSSLPFNIAQRPEGPQPARAPAGPAPRRESPGLARETHAENNGDELELVIPAVRRETPKVGRNDPCPCGSGKKFKNCCGRTA
jgi:preprotein translocase subunit SecA